MTSKMDLRKIIRIIITTLTDTQKPEFDDMMANDNSTNAITAITKPMPVP